jgi:organic radical activating enzyme
MKKIYLKEMFFHVTHVCNLTCENCDSYNNRNFKGHLFWKDYEDYYIEWSKKLDVDTINLIGGEPFANPKLIDWVNQVSKYFTSTKNFRISTNGTYIQNNIDLAIEIINKGFSFDVCVHDPALRNSIELSINKISALINATKVVNGSVTNYILNDRNVIKLYNTYVFFKASTEKIENKITFFRRSDPVKAHDLCMQECGPSHFFMKGKIYKCYLTAIASDLTNQFQFEQEGADLLNSYVPADPFDSEDKLVQFFNEIQTYIKQCQLCAERKIIKPIWPLSKSKVKF